ncbi:TonB-dependent receptor [Pontibacter sp. BT310]|uniref:TonB-dependent receptor n=1 Tax=Pontibacter populi TaxID=890055 RepID=A0ABS6XDT8_9BACT|nr:MULTISPECIES: outer membrane beta-barrel protein [Pontibacter]MBJ6119293.1 TonB-dependent receptor [Pontibacter sp. BT310]MBR0571721.1 TonB-dependent receptor [Microvirga sp. STS03]MBW3366147.1 TonB-dependent receptor [Pontibacter populi]
MKKRLLLLLGILCLFISNSTVSLAQVTTAGTGRISGVLTDSLTTKPVEFATVALLHSGSTQSSDVKLTDGQGRFTFSGLKTGSYDLIISFIGYKTKTIKQVTITEQKPEVTLPKISFSPAVTQLKEVNVQTLRPTITQEADKMVVSIEGTALAAGKSAYDVLATSPGVFIDQEGNIQLNGRAGATVMIDGKLTYLSARDLRSMLESMAAENIKNIEIITNPSARYDAEGTSGILNINLKKNTLFGVNGSASAGANYNGKQFGYSTSAIVNYKAGQWNSFLNLDLARRVFGRDATFTRVFKGDENTIYFDQVADGNGIVQGPPFVRVGTDYSLNDKHSVGFMGYYGTNKLDADFLTDTYMGYAPNQPFLYVDANNYNTNRFTNFTSNLHYAGKFDTLGTTLSADLDYVRITNKGYANFYNFEDSLLTDRPVREDFLYTETPGGFDIYSGKVDFSKPLSNSRKIEFGAKASKVTSDNDSRFYFNNGDAPVLDTTRTNHFIYDETIIAGYVNWNSLLGKNIKLQAGLRAEQTISEGDLRTTDEVKKRNYLDLFPSLFLQQRVNDNYEINYNYSRRVQRPNYGQLNPFFAYRDPYTYWLGNPELRAQYTHSIGITQVFKKTYNLILNYQLHQDVIAEIPIIETETSTTIYTIGNVDDSQSMSATAIAPIRIHKNWDTQNTFSVSYNEYSVVVNKERVVNDRVFYMLQSNHNIALPYNFKMELNGTYQSKAAYALYVVEPRWWVNTGLKKSFLEDKLDVTLNVNDIFKTQRLKLATKIGEGNVNDFDQYFRQRNVALTLRYKFSKGQKVEERRRNNLEEVNRTGG